MAKSKAKHGKKPHRFKFRNAALPARRSKPRLPRLSSNAEPADNETRNNGDAPLSPGQSLLYSGGGALAAAVTCAIFARKNWLPATFATGIATAIGGTTAAIAKNPKVQAAGQGAATAAGAQLGFVLLDNHYQEKELQAALASTKPDAKKRSNAEGLPPGALEAAYQRAVRRVALAQAASQMAA